MASSVYMMKEASISGQSFPPALMVDSVPRTIEAETTARQVRAKKRKIRFAIAGAVAAVVIAVAVAVPVVVIKQKKSNNNYRELYFPGPVEGQVDHNLYGVLEGGRTSNSQTYDRLVVFGTSYSDNAHARDPAYASSLAPEGYWSHRYSNGPVWVEYLQKYLGSNVEHLNYAYAGATTNNSIHWTPMPDTGDQTSWYLNNDYNPDMKPLIAMFTTTNDITTTFRDYLNSSSPFYHDRSKAMNLIMDSAQSLVNQLAGLIPSNTSATAPDFLILPILPVDLTPSMKEVAKNAQVAMTIAQALTMQYNSILMEGAKSIARRLGSRGNVFTYDVPALFYAMADRPAQYGLKYVDVPYTQDNVGDPKEYLFYDGLHLATNLQQRLARLSANIILGQSVMPP